MGTHELTFNDIALSIYDAGRSPNILQICTFCRWSRGWLVRRQNVSCRGVCLHYLTYRAQKLFPFPFLPLLQLLPHSIAHNAFPTSPLLPPRGGTVFATVPIISTTLQAWSSVLLQRQGYSYTRWKGVLLHRNQLAWTPRGYDTRGSAVQFSQGHCV